MGPGKQKDDPALFSQKRRKAAKFAMMTFAYRGSIVLYFMGNALHTQAAAVRADGGTTSGHYRSFLHPSKTKQFLFVERVARDFFPICLIL
jgi:hypothetical protein